MDAVQEAKEALARLEAERDRRLSKEARKVPINLAKEYRRDTVVDPNSGEVFYDQVWDANQDDLDKLAELFGASLLKSWLASGYSWQEVGKKWHLSSATACEAARRFTRRDTTREPITGWDKRGELDVKALVTLARRLP